MAKWRLANWLIWQNDCGESAQSEPGNDKAMVISVSDSLKRIS